MEASPDSHPGRVGLGRLTAIHRPLDDLDWRQFEYYFDTAPTPSWIEAKTREPKADDEYLSAVTFLDSLGRPLATKREASVNGAAAISAAASTCGTSGNSFRYSAYCVSISARFVASGSGAGAEQALPEPSSNPTMAFFSFFENIGRRLYRFCTAPFLAG